MTITRDDAITIAKDYHARKFLEAAHLTDTVPTGTCYLHIEGAREDYWYIEIPQRQVLQCGGGTFYYAISKETGKVYVIEFVGE